jgi:hypothetical protein
MKQPPRLLRRPHTHTTHKHIHIHTYIHTYSPLSSPPYRHFTPPYLLPPAPYFPSCFHCPPQDDQFNNNLTRWKSFMKTSVFESTICRGTIIPSKKTGHVKQQCRNVCLCWVRALSRVTGHFVRACASEREWLVGCINPKWSPREEKWTNVTLSFPSIQLALRHLHTINPYQQHLFLFIVFVSPPPNPSTTPPIFTLKRGG